MIGFRFCVIKHRDVKMVRAWYLDNDILTDQREPHQGTEPQWVALTTIHTFGIGYWELNADDHENDEELADIVKQRNYDHSDEITISRFALPNYDELLKTFFLEHIHPDDETRFILDGSGYFDVRHPFTDRWIRVEVAKNDMISVPPGLYHRFTVDTKNYIRAKRFFSGVPVWTPYFRPQEHHPARIAYLKKYGPIVKSC